MPLPLFAVVTSLQSAPPTNSHGLGLSLLELPLPERLRGRLVRRLLGGFAMPHAALGLAVREDLAEVAAYGFGAHSLLVAVAKPLLRDGREGKHVGLTASPDQLDLAVLGTDRQHHRFERGVEVGADLGGDGGAFAGV